MREPTKATEITALEAERNEQQVLAEGALHGERRAAIARLVMISMFGLASRLAGHVDPQHVVVGASYTAWSALLLWGLLRVREIKPRNARWLPSLMTAIDFTMITIMGLLDVRHGQGFSPGQHAVSSAIVITFAVARMGTWQVGVSVACAELSCVIVSHAGGELGSHITVFVIAGYLVLGLLIGLTNRAVGKMFRALRQRDNLTRFLPRQVAERVMRDGPGALAPVEREVTVMFSDIRGFTGMSEGLEPRALLAMLDDYFGRMSQIVKGHDGVVGKFLGDGLLAFWGVPDRLDDHAVRAVRAARDMRRVLIELNRDRERRGLPAIRIGIGIHTGRVAAGMLGGALQSEYTIIGDAVNVASRVEGLTKDHGVDVIISETTWAQLPEPRRGTGLGSAEIRGRKAPIALYTLDGSPPTVEVAAPGAATGRAG